jgi:hypothetical protein
MRKEWLTFPEGVDLGGLSASQRAEFHQHLDAAQVRLDGARQLQEAGKPLPALILYREGLSRLAKAHMASSGEEREVPDGEVALGPFVDSLAARDPAAARALRENLIGPSGDAPNLDLLRPSELTLRARALSAVTPRLLDSIRPGASERARVRRIVSWGAIVAILGACLAIFVVTVFRPENIALNKPAKASSYALGTEAKGAVNGRRYENFGYHSEKEESPWLEIDLGGAYELTKARVYARHDCCYDQSIPMVFEVSDDGATYRVIEKRKHAFDAFDPWEISLRHTKARFVRLRRVGKGWLVLAEVELEGRRLN